jgi:hypothetical protein
MFVENPRFLFEAVFAAGGKEKKKKKKKKKKRVSNELNIPLFPAFKNQGYNSPRRVGADGF